MMFRFQSPWMLLLLALVALAALLRRRGRFRAALRFPSVSLARAVPPTWRQRLAGLPVAFRVAALVLVVIALARPQMGTERVVETSRGVAIEMVVDRSSSMGAELLYRGRPANRLEVALDLFREFVAGGRGLAGRPSDLIGLVTFARYAETVCPLTLSHETLLGFLPTVKLVEVESEDGTAIGDAVALAAARLRTAEETLARQAAPRREYEIRSKLIVLLTDGENNAGVRTPLEAARLAASWGIRIYAIGIGGQAPPVMETPFGRYSLPVGPQVDEETLRSLAETSGGRYWIAADAEALRAVYAEIDKLEKSDLEAARYLNFRELFAPFVLAALALVAAELVLNSLVWRRIP
jgi:Ca-activated chloride channel family protein